MEAVFLKLLNMSIVASWLILAVILLRFFLKKTPKWIMCVLWALVAVRLICPTSLESITSLIPSAEVIQEDILYSDEPSIATGVSCAESGGQHESAAGLDYDCCIYMGCWRYHSFVLCRY